MRLSNRDLFLVTMIVALAVGWWVDRRRLAAELDRLELDQVAGEIWVELGSDPHGWKKNEELKWKLAEVLNSQAPAPNPPFLAETCGKE